MVCPHVHMSHLEHDMLYLWLDIVVVGGNIVYTQLAVKKNIWKRTVLPYYILSLVFLVSRAHLHFMPSSTNQSPSHEDMKVPVSGGECVKEANRAITIIDTIILFLSGGGRGMREIVLALQERCTTPPPLPRAPPWTIYVGFCDKTKQLYFY